MSGVGLGKLGVEVGLEMTKEVTKIGKKSIHITKNIGKQSLGVGKKSLGLGKEGLSNLGKGSSDETDKDVT